MAATFVLGLLLGLAVGVVIGRRNQPSEVVASSSTTPATSAGTIASSLGIVPVVPTKKAKKAGITEESFRPTDDILLKMQAAWEHGSGGEGLGPGAAALIEDPEVQERMRRVFERLEGPATSDDEPRAPDSDHR